ncbi:hypothetical protein EYF80_008234 [Liparis tanakae]|uniref:Uncharacterized protein n=1 Tax=Liparis tanakae TaxID=230148 RepID=A0A4Z2IW18_9TELE|nr:hypothetical protein EYF80_008234 [Liparis tanakae]
MKQVSPVGCFPPCSIINEQDMFPTLLPIMPSGREAYKHQGTRTDSQRRGMRAVPGHQANQRVGTSLNCPGGQGKLVVEQVAVRLGVVGPQGVQVVGQSLERVRPGAQQDVAERAVSGRHMIMDQPQHDVTREPGRYFRQLSHLVAHGRVQVLLGVQQCPEERVFLKGERCDCYSRNTHMSKECSGVSNRVIRGVRVHQHGRGTHFGSIGYL